MSGVATNQNWWQQVPDCRQWRTRDGKRALCTGCITTTRCCYMGHNMTLTGMWLVLLVVAVYSGVGGVVSGAAVPGGSSSSSGSVAPRAAVCDIVGCECRPKAAVWTVVNCTLFEYQDMQIHPRSVPVDLIELQISAAGGSVTIHADALLGLRGFNRLLVEGARTLRMRTHAVHNLTTASVLIQARHCGAVWLERAAIMNSETAVTVEVSNSEVVTIEGSAFSRLHEARFTDIADLQLHEGAFTFEHMKTYVRHGPVTSVSFHSVVIPRVPRACFGSALAGIHIRDSRIGDVERAAFKAKEISAISVTNTSVGRFRTGAMIDDLHVVTLEVTGSRVHVVETGAIVAAFTNFVIEHSRLDMVQPKAINTPVVAHVHLLDNEFRALSAHALTFRNWNHIRINHNIVKHMHSNFLNIAETTTAEEFTFIGNEVYNVEDNSLRFVADLDQLATSSSRIVFDNNFFNQTCHCDIGAWLARVANSSAVDFIVNSSFCTVDALLGNCFELPEGLINMRNFTELVCGPENYIKCEPYNGETKVLDTTAIMLLDDISQSSSSRFVLYLTLGCLFIVAIIATVIILLVRGAIWLDHKGYCDRFKLQYSSDHQQTDEDGDDDNNAGASRDNNTDTTTEDLLTNATNISTSSTAAATIAGFDDVPDELTPELLQSLRERLDDPTTHAEAREMIEKLYEMFIVDDTYTNNNRAEGMRGAYQQEDAHLYEELGLHLNNHQTSNKDTQQKYTANSAILTGTDFSSNLLKLMEDLIPDDGNKPAPAPAPTLANEYSEPSDAEIHVYSELKQNVKTNNERKDSLKSSGGGSSSGASSRSGKMAFRPLPAKPTCARDQEGTSIKAGTSTQ